MTQRFTVSRDTLVELYLKQNLSAYKIGPLIGCSWSTVINRLKEYRIPLKSIAASRMRYSKRDFQGSLKQKAYMIGFRIGDLNVYRPGLRSETIVVRCHTTQKKQADIIHDLFKDYGKVTISNAKGHLHINCFLNNSFYFLLSKDRDSWSWLDDNPGYYLPFIAGYTDAEGNLILNQGRARLKIDSYDFDVLKKISFWLDSNQIKNKFKCIYKKGERLSRVQVCNKDLWRLNINEAPSLYKFLQLILPFLKHRKRIQDAKLCINNIEGRRKNGSVTY